MAFEKFGKLDPNANSGLEEIPLDQEVNQDDTVVPDVPAPDVPDTVVPTPPEKQPW